MFSLAVREQEFCQQLFGRNVAGYLRSAPIPKFTGFPFHAPLPRSRTPAGRAATGLSRHLPHGPRWVYGEDSCIGAFVAQSRGFSALRRAQGLELVETAHCQRFVPASRLTTHDLFTAAWLHALPCGILTRWAPSQSFFFCTVFFHMCFGFLSVCALLGAKTPFLPATPIPSLTVSGAAGAKEISL